MTGKYYTYLHIDPETDEVLYVGMGQGTRAYYFGTNPSDKTRYGHRDAEHSAHLTRLYESGLLPHEWVEFVENHVDKETAKATEKEFIEKCSPKYNKKAGIKSLLFSEQEVIAIQQMRNDGMIYRHIAEEMGCSTMVIYRILNNQSPRYKEMLIESK